MFFLILLEMMAQPAYPTKAEDPENLFCAIEPTNAKDHATAYYRDMYGALEKRTHHEAIS